MAVNGRVIQGRLFTIITIILVLECVLTGYAHGFAGGTGEPNDPYQIATVEDLLAVGSSEELLTKHYVLVNDLDLDPNLPGGRVFDDALIAASTYVEGKRLAPFRGVLNGAGYTIRNLCVSCEQGSGIGLIGNLSGQVRDLHVQNARISGASAVGAIAGFVFGGSLLRCSAAGEISGSATGAGGVIGHLSDGILVDCRADVGVRGVRLVGGLFGSSTGGTVSRCEAKGRVSGDQFVGGLGGHLWECFVIESRAAGVVTGADDVGGLLGYTLAGRVIRCGAVCEVTAKQTAGGLIGSAYSMSGGSIVDSYARGSVAGSSAGGLVGISSMLALNVYAACEMIPMNPNDGTPAIVGGLFGEANYLTPAQAMGCLWDAELSGVSVIAGSDLASYDAGLSTERMQQQATFEQAGWDFRSVWTMTEGEYPVLQWESAADAAQDQSGYN